MVENFRVLSEFQKTSDSLQNYIVKITTHVYCKEYTIFKNFMISWLNIIIITKKFRYIWRNMRKDYFQKIFYFINKQNHKKFYYVWIESITREKKIYMKIELLNNS